MTAKRLVLRALRTHQARSVPTYCFFLPGEQIVRIADITRMRRDGDTTLQGFQRNEIRSHVNAIVDYLDQGDVLFPNAIILALNDAVEFRQARGREPTGSLGTADIGTLTIPLDAEGKAAAWIVDGQQRSLALSRTRNKKIPVPVVAFIAPDLRTQREQFILVNKARPLPTRLINELLPDVDTYLPRDLAIRKIPSELCNLLNRDPTSPFHKLIRRMADTGGDKHHVVDTAIIEILKRSINTPLGALSQYKGMGSEPSDIDGMYKMLLLYWTAVRDVFPEAWGRSPSASRLMHSAGLKAMGVLMDRIMARAYNQPDPSAEVRSSLLAIAPHCRWTEGVWDALGLPWNGLQSVPKHIRALADLLVRLDYEATRRRAK